MISIDSGYNNAIYYAKSNDEYLRFLNCFLLGNREALNLEFEEHPEFLDSQKKKALFLLNRMFLGYKISSFHISIQSPKPSLLDELAYE